VSFFDLEEVRSRIGKINYRLRDPFLVATCYWENRSRLLCGVGMPDKWFDQQTSAHCFAKKVEKYPAYEQWATLAMPRYGMGCKFGRINNDVDRVIKPYFPFGAEYHALDGQGSSYLLLIANMDPTKWRRNILKEAIDYWQECRLYILEVRASPPGHLLILRFLGQKFCSTKVCATRVWAKKLIKPRMITGTSASLYYYKFYSLLEKKDMEGKKF